ncbi:translation elongation factor EF-1 subunit alpha [Picrophilus oshimae]|uniref:Elongation factor 1-alpha n=2 Tax=Picrophilus torridus (strain ATCC 700027 / DSM 9790 / JCM 10055 / NBRC 100828 / KAW 2/3) TaxID=1122961 RepID=EF1A_PICTO|nr:translation elongation factor EF-1 subunit alpha [Picrophilus oshimae]Q6L202.1 RecName: Full=Elongation factor 1-alpha; Short=EF-1-alpha; AltName: Full=Elongation factor Tu; Short=EF-Tu [Picrophilus oshimae DSM 9789]AAT43000.1 protein translation elongation factor Tu [Picrophilus oshimae DSM 9789]SMD30698.1 translation elongation factor 1A (EF-1A/EF-Tu) [Picrophilus oshimae DSM 9789]
MASEKPHMNLVIIGHVDHGKSTLVGRLLFEHGEIPQHIIDEYKKEAEEKGKATFEFAWVMDRFKEERERGVTIDLTHRKFETDKYYFTIIDAPGHRDFVKNMITGTSQADAAVLVVSAREGEGVMAQTKEHAFLARTLGVPQLIAVVNKMDATQPPYSEKRFNEVKDEITKLLTPIGFKNVPIIPLSGYKGDNIMKPSPNLSWWKGPTLMEALNALQVPAKPVDKPLRLPVEDVYSITGIGTVPVGRIETGVMKVGDKVIFMPANKAGDVKSIEMHHEPMQQAGPGDNIGFNVRGIAKNELKRGDVCGPANNPPTVVKGFTAQIVVLNHPSVIAAGYKPVFHVHTAQVACRIDEIVKTINPKDGTTLKEKPDFIKTGDIAIVKVVPDRALVIEKVSEFPQLGRFAIRDMGMTVAAGQCIDLEKA